MSAQDTTPGHLLSTNALAFLMLSNPSTLSPLLSAASFSAASLLPGFVDIRIDPSQPCNFQELLNFKKTERSPTTLLLGAEDSGTTGGGLRGVREKRPEEFMTRNAAAELEEIRTTRFGMKFGSH